MYDLRIFESAVSLWVGTKDTGSETEYTSDAEIGLFVLWAADLPERCLVRGIPAEWSLRCPKICSWYSISRLRAKILRRDRLEIEHWQTQSTFICPSAPEAPCMC